MTCFGLCDFVSLLFVVLDVVSLTTLIKGAGGYGQVMESNTMFVYVLLEYHEQCTLSKVQ